MHFKMALATGVSYEENIFLGQLYSSTATLPLRKRRKMHLEMDGHPHWYQSNFWVLISLWSGCDIQKESYVLSIKPKFSETSV